MTTLSELLASPRMVIDAELAPIAGTRFQPTGFPDLGPALYEGPDGVDMVLVESAQSMANHLEGMLWNEDHHDPAPVVEGLPYMRVETPDGDYLTSSRTDSHRLGSAYVKGANFDGTPGIDLIGGRLGLIAGRPIDHAQVHRAVFGLDPIALVHGVFFADNHWPGQPKIARALTAFVEARGVRPAHSGGLRRDDVDNTGKTSGGHGTKRGSEEGFGHVPFARTEFVADRIAASFVVDTTQIDSYGLDVAERELLLAVALFEIRSLLDGGLRLRTACDLAVEGITVRRPADTELPDREFLRAAVRERITSPVSPLVGVFG